MCSRPRSRIFLHSLTINILYRNKINYNSVRHSRCEIVNKIPDMFCHEQIFSTSTFSSYVWMFLCTFVVVADVFVMFFWSFLVYFPLTILSLALFCILFTMFFFFLFLFITLLNKFLCVVFFDFVSFFLQFT